MSSRWHHQPINYSVAPLCIHYDSCRFFQGIFSEMQGPASLDSKSFGHSTTAWIDGHQPSARNAAVICPNRLAPLSAYFYFRKPRELLPNQKTAIRALPSTNHRSAVLGVPSMSSARVPPAQRHQSPLPFVDGVQPCGLCRIPFFKRNALQLKPACNGCRNFGGARHVLSLVIQYVQRVTGHNT